MDALICFAEEINALVVGTVYELKQKNADFSLIAAFSSNAQEIGKELCKAKVKFNTIARLQALEKAIEYCEIFCFFLAILKDCSLISGFTYSLINNKTYALECKIVTVRQALTDMGTT